MTTIILHLVRQKHYLYLKPTTISHQFITQPVHSEKLSNESSPAPLTTASPLQNFIARRLIYPSTTQTKIWNSLTIQFSTRETTIFADTTLATQSVSISDSTIASTSASAAESFSDSLPTIINSTAASAAQMFLSSSIETNMPESPAIEVLSSSNLVVGSQKQASASQPQISSIISNVSDTTSASHEAQISGNIQLHLQSSSEETC